MIFLKCCVILFSNILRNINKEIDITFVSRDLDIFLSFHRRNPYGFHENFRPKHGIFPEWSCYITHVCVIVLTCVMCYVFSKIC